MTSKRKRPIDVLQMSKHKKKKKSSRCQIDVSVMYVCYQGIGSCIGFNANSNGPCGFLLVIGHLLLVAC